MRAQLGDSCKSRFFSTLKSCAAFGFIIAILFNWVMGAHAQGDGIGAVFKSQIVQDNPVIADALECPQISDNGKTQLINQIDAYNLKQGLPNTLKNITKDHKAQELQLSQEKRRLLGQIQDIDDDISKFANKSSDDLLLEEYQVLDGMAKAKLEELQAVETGADKITNEELADLKNEYAELTAQAANMLQAAKNRAPVDERNTIIEELEDRRYQEVNILNDLKNEIEENLKQQEQKIAEFNRQKEGKRREICEQAAQANGETLPDDYNIEACLAKYIGEFDKDVDNISIILPYRAECMLNNARNINALSQADTATSTSSGDSQTPSSGITLTPINASGSDLGRQDQQSRAMRQVFPETEWRLVHDEFDQKIDQGQAGVPLNVFFSVTNLEQFASLYGSYWEGVVIGAASVFNPSTNAPRFEMLCDFIYTGLTNPYRLRDVLGEEFDAFLAKSDADNITFLGQFGGAALGGKAIEQEEVKEIIQNARRKRLRRSLAFTTNPKLNVDPNTINFSQRIVNANVSDYERAMASGKWDWSKSGPIRVMEQNGQYVTYDNRLLLAAQQSGIKNVPIEIVPPCQVMPASTLTWADAFQSRFADPSNIQAGGAVPVSGIAAKDLQSADSGKDAGGDPTQKESGSWNRTTVVTTVGLAAGAGLVAAAAGGSGGGNGSSNTTPTDSTTTTTTTTTTSSTTTTTSTSSSTTTTTTASPTTTTSTSSSTTTTSTSSSTTSSTTTTTIPQANGIPTFAQITGDYTFQSNATRYDCETLPQSQTGTANVSGSGPGQVTITGWNLVNQGTYSNGDYAGSGSDDEADEEASGIFSLANGTGVDYSGTLRIEYRNTLPSCVIIYQIDMFMDN